MTLIQTRMRVTSDGKIIVPVGIESAGEEVEVTISPVVPDANFKAAEYRKTMERLAGSWEGELEEPVELPYEKARRVLMPFLLDTNVWSDFLSGRDQRVVSKVLGVKTSGDLLFCSVVKAELLYGAVKSKRPENLQRLETLFAEHRSLPFDDAAAVQYGHLRPLLEAAGQIIGPNDLLIASIGLANDLTVVTRNMGEFSRVPGLRVENWHAA